MDLSDENFEAAPTAGPVEPIVPSPDGSALLDDLISLFRRYVILDEDALVALGLWVAHTHAFEAAEVTPYIVLTSAEKRSGKSRLLELLERLVSRPLMTGRVTAALLPRLIDAEQPTLLLDEADTIFRGESAETLRGIINTGFVKGGKSSINVPDGKSGWVVRHFNTYCPKVIAGIGSVPDTVMDRSIVIEMRRKGAARRSCASAGASCRKSAPPSGKPRRHGLPRTSTCSRPHDRTYRRSSTIEHKTSGKHCWRSPTRSETSGPSVHVERRLCSPPSVETTSSRRWEELFDATVSSSRFGTERRYTSRKTVRRRRIRPQAASFAKAEVVVPPPLRLLAAWLRRRAPRVVQALADPISTCCDNDPPPANRVAG